MKKILAILLAISISASLCACMGTNSDIDEATETSPRQSGFFGTNSKKSSDNYKAEKQALIGVWGALLGSGNDYDENSTFIMFSEDGEATLVLTSDGEEATGKGSYYFDDDKLYIELSNDNELEFEYLYDEDDKELRLFYGSLSFIKLDDE